VATLRIYWSASNWRYEGAIMDQNAGLANSGLDELASRLAAIVESSAGMWNSASAIPGRA
jgi:hypothetical protein